MCDYNHMLLGLNILFDTSRTCIVFKKRLIKRPVYRNKEPGALVGLFLSEAMVHMLLSFYILLL